MATGIGHDTYQPKTAGLVHGGGPRRFKRARWNSDRWQDIPLSDGVRIRAEVPDYDPEETYTQHEIMMLTEKILRSDEKPFDEHPMVLFAEHYRYRFAHEIYTANGTPDPNIVSGLYWRTHPNGVAFNSDEVRAEKGTAFYNH